MNNYMNNSYNSEWGAPDTMKRYSMYLTPKGELPPLGYAGEGKFTHSWSCRGG